MPSLGLLLLPIPIDSISWPYVGYGIALLALTCRIFGTHRTLKWPIFLFLTSLIFVDLVFYVLVRLGIGLFSRGGERTLEEAKDFDQWFRAATVRDHEEGRDSWRAEDASRQYDWRHVMATTERLRVAREAGDSATLMSLLLLSLKNNAFGELDFELYTRARTGTKKILEDYRDEVCHSLQSLGDGRGLHPGSLGYEARREFCMAARANMGGCALVLSGGATFGIFHFGVVKGLVDLGMMPPLVCGASAGAVVASVACTRSDDELRRILADQTDLYREMGPGGPLHGTLLWKLGQILRNGKIYNALDFQKHMEWFAMGLTFREVGLHELTSGSSWASRAQLPLFALPLSARCCCLRCRCSRCCCLHALLILSPPFEPPRGKAYEKTGRVLTISCTPLRSRGRRAMPLMLNHISTPHVDIASAVCASACVPGLIEPVELLEKAADDTLVPYHMADDADERIRMRDGSFESDVPLEALAATFGATFTIVSQVNPHVAPFYTHLQGRAGRPSGGRDRTGAWRGGFLLGALEVTLKEDMRTHLRAIKRLELGRALFGVDWSNLWLQPQDGSVVLTPRLQLSNWVKVLSNLDQREELEGMIQQMERCVWEASSLIRARMDVQHALDECAYKFEAPAPARRVPSAGSSSKEAEPGVQGGAPKRDAIGQIPPSPRRGPSTTDPPPSKHALPQQLVEQQSSMGRPRASPARRR